MFKKLSLALLLFVLTTNTSCANGINQQKDISVSKEKSLNLKGKVVFPDGFKTKAESVSTLSTVSIIYPANDTTNPNKTIATGVTDNNGYFSINPSPTFIPQNNQIFVVEAIRRVEQYNTNNPKDSNLQSLRSFIRWNGSNWDSITSNDLVIDTMTTGISILSSYTNTNPNDTINKVNNGSPSVIGFISVDRINRLSDMVRVCLNEKRDPYASIKLIDNEYYIDRNYDVGKLLTSDDLTGLTLSYTNLAGANLSGKNLSGMDLTGINLKNSNLNGSNLDNTNLTNANLSHSLLYKTRISNAIVNNTDISDTDLNYTNFDNTELDNANLSKIYISNVKLTGNFINTNFSGSIMDSCNFSEARLDKANIESASLYNANLSGLDLSGKNLSFISLEGAITTDTVFTNSNFFHAKLSAMDFRDKDLSNVNFEEADLSYANFLRANLTNVNFKSSDLSSTDLRNQNLSNKDFTNSNLYDANLYKANITNANFAGANLGRAKWIDGRICADDSIGECKQR